MKMLAQLESEAQTQEDALENPRLFLVIMPEVLGLPPGPYNGRFLDPFLGIIELNGVKGHIMASDLPMWEIKASWAEGSE